MLGSFTQTAGIVAGPDGNLWFTDPQENRVGFLNPTTKAISLISVPTSSSDPQGITVGPDGNIWFTEFAGGKIGQVNISTHAVTEFPLPTLGGEPLAITTGPDGNLWLTESRDVASFNPTTHDTTRYPVTQFTSNQSTQGIVAGPDGNLWFGQYTISGGTTTNEIARIDPATGVITSYSAVANAGITVGPDGEIWFVSPGSLSEINPTSGVVSSYTVIPAQSNPPFLGGGIVTGPDMDLYFDGYSLQRATIIPADQGALISNIYLDPEANGTFTGGPLANQLAYLDLKGDGHLDPGDPTAVSDGSGYYMFTGLTPGTYTLRLLVNPGTLATSPT